MKKEVFAKDDELTHVYTLIISANNTFKVGLPPSLTSPLWLEVFARESTLASRHIHSAFPCQVFFSFLLFFGTFSGYVSHPLALGFDMCLSKVVLCP
jgi:hypothetical protein